MALSPPAVRVGQTANPAARPVLDRLLPVDRVPVVYLVVSVGAALAMQQSRAVATIESAVVLLAVVFVVLFSRRIELILAGVSYVVATEALWRMTGSKAPWEIGKYILVIGFGIACLRFPGRRRSMLPLVFIGVLIPSCAITLAETGFSAARDAIVFNVGGAVALGIAVLFLQRVQASATEVTQLIWVIVGPLLGVAAVVARNIAKAGHISFSDNSNFVTSGGFGPNQVSLVLGLGALLCLLILLRGVRGRTGVFVLVLCGLFLGESLLTFSRGGVYTAAVGAMGIALAGLLTSGTRSKVLTRALLIGILSLLVVSWVNSFTGGSLGMRYADQGTTGRSDIAASELRLFGQNPVWGVGPGQRSAHEETGDTFVDTDASHTEYTRLLAEHGVLGLVAIGIMLAMAWRSFRSQTDRWGRLFAAGTIFWALMAMTHAGMRLGVIPLVFALAAIRVEPSAVEATAVGIDARA